MRTELVHVVKMKELETLIEKKYKRPYYISYYETTRYFPNIQSKDKVTMFQHTKRVENFLLGAHTYNLLPNLLSELIADNTLPSGSYLII